MFFLCLDRRVLGFVFLVASAAFYSGCGRETRDFHTGGPRRREDRSASDKDKYFATQGPQSAMETNAFALSQGKQLYISFNCVGCHSNGGGDIGPALMDDKWIYGARPADIISSILDGRPNGMPAFRGRINQTQAEQLTAYVRSLSGQAREDAATSRSDDFKGTLPENSSDRETPKPDNRPKL